MTGHPGRVSPRAVLGLIVLGLVTVLIGLIGIAAVGWRITRAAACSAAGDNELHVATHYHPISDTCTVRVFGTDINIFKNNPGVVMTTKHPALTATRRQLLAEITLKTDLQLPEMITFHDEEDVSRYVLGLNFGADFTAAYAWARSLDIRLRTWDNPDTHRTYIAEDGKTSRPPLWHGWQVNISGSRPLGTPPADQQLGDATTKALTAIAAGETPA